MNIGNAVASAGLAALVFLGAQPARAQQTPYLTGPEVDKLRDAQDPSERIKAYLDLQQSRLDEIQELNMQQPETNQGANSQFKLLLGQYVSITDEMKDWISDQYQRHGDMRKGLKDLIERGPKQLDVLKHLQQESGSGAGGANEQLQDAIDDMSDAIDGGTKAFSDQQKAFGELEKEQKLDAKEVKELRKEQEKRQKQEEKLRKRMDKQHAQDD